MTSLSVEVKKGFMQFFTQRPRYVAAYVPLYIVLYVLLDWLSFIHPMVDLNITPWIPQSALAVGLLLWRPGAWWLAWIAIVIAESVVKATDTPWGPTMLSASALTIGYALIAAALTRWLGRRPQVVTRKDFMTFLVIVTAGALVGSFLHVLALSAFGIPPPGRFLVAIHRGWIGNAVGLLVTLPLVFVLTSAERRAVTRGMLRSVEWWLVVLVAAFGVAAVFSQPADAQFKFFYLLFLPVVWAAARFGVAGAVWAAALVQVFLVVAFQSGVYRPLTVSEFQLLMATLAATGLLLGTTVDEREEAAHKLRASLRLAAAGDMAAALAHELNQPLLAMSNYARASQLLAQRLGEHDQEMARPFSEVTGKLVNEANRAGEVVNRLRNFFRDRATDLQPTNMQKLMDEVLSAHAARAHAQQIRIDWSCDSELRSVWLDSVQIAVVLRNLVANAIDAASAAHGEDGSASVTVRAVRDDDMVTVSVIDNGPGLSGEDPASVFESRRSDKPGGMGIGLGISRSIVEGHGGRMWAELGPGGRFHFSLPASVSCPHE